MKDGVFAVDFNPSFTLRKQYTTLNIQCQHKTTNFFNFFDFCCCFMWFHSKFLKKYVIFVVFY